MFGKKEPDPSHPHGLDPKLFEDTGVDFDSTLPMSVADETLSLTADDLFEDVSELFDDVPTQAPKKKTT